MKKRILSVMLTLAMLVSVLPQVLVSADEPQDVAYLFAYFTGNNPEQERMYYGISTDGYNFTAINGGNPVYTNPVGTECLRDPYIFEGEDGKFYALATDMKSSLGWASNRSIITMVSDDLINWETNLIPVTTLFTSMSAADRVWAPQAIYDSETGKYMIYLAIRTQDGSTNGSKTLMYRCWTTDFKTITEPELMFAPSDGSSAIDGDIIYSAADSKYYMYYKNEDTARLYTATATSLSDTFTETGNMLPCNNSAGNEAGVEGPAAYKLIGQDTYNIIYDAYGEGFFVMSQTTDHKNFTQLEQSKYSFNFTPRHGYVITINQSEYDKLMKTYGGDDTVRLNPADASPFNNGEFQGWGTSMGWWGNRIGYSDTLAESAAELFYSDEGLGLDIVRYNVGGGDDPTHDHVTRSDSKLPCFAVPQYETDGTTLKADENGDVIYGYDWTADHNQVNVLTKIKAENPDVHIEGYTNSPPWFMTISGCSGGGTNAGDENLDPENYDNFAEFLADVTEHMASIGLPFDSYSPMNEPNPATKYWTALNAKQEGNLVAPGEHQSGVINALSSAYDAREIDTMVVGLDETSIDYSITSFAALDDTAKANLDRLDTHTYSGSKRAQLKQTAIDAGKNLWMSEVDHGGTAGTGSGDMGMALDLANLILNDVNGMQPSAWVMWDILDLHKDSEFTAPDGTKTEANNTLNQSGGLWGVGMVNHDTQKIELTQKYYGYGQFTKYIEPGMTIIASSSNSVAAYDKDTGKIVIVAVNFTNTDKLTEFDLRDFSATGTSAKVIRTSGSYASGEHWAQLAPIPVSGKEFYAPVKANSITTFVIEPETPAPVGYMTIEGSTSVVTGVDYSYAAYINSAETAANVTWSVSDESIATVSADGTLRAAKGGTVTLTATTADGVYTSIDINVIDAASSIKIVNKKSGLGLETKSKGVASGTQLVQWSDRGLDTAAWKLSGTADGHFNITNANDNMLLAANADAKPVISNTVETTDDSAKWDLINHSGYYEIKNVSVGKSLNVSGQSVANGGSVILYDFGGGDNELWSFEEVTGELEHVVPVVVDYADKYKDTNYNFVRNVDSLTNDFNDGDPKGFATTGFAGLGSDADGEAVLLPQNSLSNNSSTQRAGTALLTLDEGVTCASPIEMFEATASGLSYKYTLANAFDNYDKYFAVYDSTGLLKKVTKNESETTENGDFSDCTYKLMVWDNMRPVNYNEIINLSFDMFTPNSLGDSDFVLSSSDGAELVKIKVNNWGNTYSVTIGDTDVETAGDGATYFKNKLSDKVNTSSISNGGHVEVYYTPVTGDVTVTVKSVTSTADLKTYTGTVDAGKNIGSVYFAGTYTQWNKIMVVDNLLTNIIVEK